MQCSFRLVVYFGLSSAMHEALCLIPLKLAIAKKDISCYNKNISSSRGECIEWKKQTIPILPWI